MTDLNSIPNAHRPIVSFFLAGAALLGMLFTPQGVRAQFPQQAENTVGGSFTGPEFVERFITTTLPSAQSVFARDLDGDGDADVLSASRNDDKIAWYENTGGGSFSDQKVITTNAEGATSVFARDLDGDGDADVLSASTGGLSDSKIAWYENTGGGSFFDQEVITTNAEGATSVFARDLDGDGDADVLSASLVDDKIAWYENTGGGSFSDQKVITTSADRAASVYARDLDGDSDADVLSASQLDDKIVWYENTGGGSFSGQKVITTDAAEALSVFARDLDGDGDADVLSASEADNTVAWYRNDLASILAEQSATVDTNGEVDFGATGADINFSGASGSGEVTVTKFDIGPTDTTGISGTNVSSYHLTISARGDLEFNSDTEVQLDVSTLDGIGEASNVTIYKRPNKGSGQFTALSTSFDSNANELVATTGSFSEFVLASNDADNPLPVELAGFEATVEDETVRLTWQTASETGNARFEVQRRVGDGVNGGEGAWATIGSVDGAGTTSEVQSYQFTDEDLPYAADRLEYRLRQVDTDGSAQFSKTVVVERGVTQVELLGTVPNPARGHATVRYAVPDRQEVAIHLYDVLGRKVRTVVQAEQEGRHERTLDTVDLSSGVYFLRLTAGGQTRTQKLTVVR